MYAFRPGRNNGASRQTAINDGAEAGGAAPSDPSRPAETRGDYAKQLEHHRGAGERGHAAEIEGRRDLDDVGADDRHAAEATRSIACASRVVMPPISGVPVPGAMDGSITSMSKET